MVWKRGWNQVWSFRNHHQFLNPLTCFNPQIFGAYVTRFKPPLWSQARIIKDGDTKTKFADVAGCDGAKTELMEAPKTKKNGWVWGNQTPGVYSHPLFRWWWILLGIFLDPPQKKPKQLRFRDWVLPNRIFPNMIMIFSGEVLNVILVLCTKMIHGRSG